jgi:hypothetical protein
VILEVTSERFSRLFRILMPRIKQDWGVWHQVVDALPSNLKAKGVCVLGEGRQKRWMVLENMVGF